VAVEFSWSISRRDTFQSCRRKYYYSYYASNDDPEIKRLKKLSGLPLWAGSVVHETIEGLLKTRDTMPSETEQEAIVRAAVHGRMLGDWRDSESCSLRPARSRTSPTSPVFRRDSGSKASSPAAS
jgi:hypothetical protein